MIDNLRLKFAWIFPAFLFGISCTNQSKPDVITAFRQMSWPQVRELTTHGTDGKVSVSRSESSFSGDNKLITITRTEGKRDIDLCTMTLSPYEVPLGYECESNGVRDRVDNTLDDRGRIISAVYDFRGDNSRADTGRYEYFGNNTVFYAYRKGVLLWTGLVEKSSGREKYTTWHNLPEPSIHVRDYTDSGAGSETYVAASSPFTETSKTNTYVFGDEKITVIIEKSREYPQSVLYMEHKFWESNGKRRMERDYMITEPQLELSDIPDFDAAKQLIARAKMTRESKSYPLKI